VFFPPGQCKKKLSIPFFLVKIYEKKLLNYYKFLEFLPLTIHFSKNFPEAAAGRPSGDGRHRNRGMDSSPFNKSLRE
jgi:hypothetical protein